MVKIYFDDNGKRGRWIASFEDSEIAEMFAYEYSRQLGPNDIIQSVYVNNGVIDTGDVVRICNGQDLD